MVEAVCRNKTRRTRYGEASREGIKDQYCSTQNQHGNQIESRMCPTSPTSMRGASVMKGTSSKNDYAMKAWKEEEWGGIKKRTHASRVSDRKKRGKECRFF